MTTASFFRWPELSQFAMTPQIRRRSISGERVMVAQFHLSQGAAVAQHSHPQEQIICILSGIIEFESNGEKRVLRTGDVVHLPSNVSHGGIAMEDTVTLEIFSPPREELLTEATPEYMRG